MSTPLTDTIENLTSYINEVTDGDDSNLSDAVATLAEGYGRYSIDDFANGEEQPVGDIILNSEIITDGAFFDRTQITSVTAPRATSIGNTCFYACTSLISVNMPNLITIDVTGKSFYLCTKLTDVIFPKVTAIPSSAFQYCYALKNVDLRSVIDLAGGAFRNCTSLSTIKLPKVTNINQSSFSGCTALTDIYLPNAESTYTGAPWGATNATIHYNTLFDENGEPILE